MRDQTTIAVVPARGNSSLRDKHLLEVKGKPVVAYSLEWCLNLPVDAVVLTSDSQDILNVARHYPDVIPLHRPPLFASDHSTLADVYRHAVDFFEASEEVMVDTVVGAQGCVIIRPSDLYHRARAVFDELAECTCVSSFCEARTHPNWTFDLQKKPEWATSRAPGHPVNRQQLEKVYQRDGGIYLFKRRNLDSHDVWAHVGGQEAWVLNPKGAVLDIDSEMDLLLARAIIEPIHIFQNNQT